MRSESSRKKVVLVCMIDSIHTARWLENCRHEGVDFILFPSTPNRRVHPSIRALVEGQVESNANYLLFPIFKWLSIPMYVLDLVLQDRLRGHIVSRLVKEVGASHLHSLELNHSGKISMKALSNLSSGKPLVIATVWGSDIYWFGRFEKHRKYLIKILETTDVLISECSRDLRLAKSMGFRGNFLKSETFFGFTESEVHKERKRASERRIILVKGYESFVGRVSIAIDALKALSDEVSRYDIHVYSTTWKSRKLIKKYNRNSINKITYYKKHALSHVQIMSLFNEARIHLGVSLSDGVPASMLESMVSGAFPIQSNTACSDGWLIDQVNGLVVTPELESIVGALKRALIDDELVDNAMAVNQEIAKSRLSDQDVSSRISSLNVYR